MVIHDSVQFSKIVWRIFSGVSEENSAIKQFNHSSSWNKIILHENEKFHSVWSPLRPSLKDHKHDSILIFGLEWESWNEKLSHLPSLSPIKRCQSSFNFVNFCLTTKWPVNGALITKIVPCTSPTSPFFSVPFFPTR